MARVSKKNQASTPGLVKKALGRMRAVAPRPDSGPLMRARLLQRQADSGPQIFELLVLYQRTGWRTAYLGHSLIDANRTLAGIVEGLDPCPEPLTVVAEWCHGNELPEV